MAENRVRKTVLKNGLRIVSESLPDRESLTIGVWVEVGSRHEDERVAGVSHLLEHMVFKGTKERSPREIAQSIERLGGTLNAFTSREHTCYHVRVLHQHLAAAVDVLADISTRATIPTAEVRKERFVVAEEIKDTHDTPHEWVHEMFSNQIWPGHPIGRPIAGTVPSVMAMTRKDLRDHRKRYYRPDRMLIAAGGRLSHDRLVRLVKKAFQLEEQTQAAPVPSPPNGLSSSRAVAGRDISQAHVCRGFPALRFADKRRHVSRLSSSILGGGMSSRLFQTVREKSGLVYAIYTFHDAFHDSGFFGVYFACDPSQVVKASNLVIEQIGRLARTPVGKTELHDVKSQLRGNLMMGLESIPPRTHRLARHELYLGGYIPPEQTMRSIMKVSPADIKALAKQTFVPERLAAAILGPVPDKVIGQIDFSKLKPSAAKRRRK